MISSRRERLAPEDQAEEVVVPVVVLVEAGEAPDQAALEEDRDVVALVPVAVLTDRLADVLIQAVL